MAFRVMRNKRNQRWTSRLNEIFTESKHNRSLDSISRKGVRDSVRMNIYFGPNQISNIIYLSQIVQIKQQILFVL